MSAGYGPAQRFLFFLAGLLGKWAVVLYYSTIRIVKDRMSESGLNRHPRPRAIFAFWHSHQLSTLWHYRRTGAAILVSASRDGEYISRVAASLGYLPIRGSSSRRGAVGLKELIRLARQGRTVGITPDGPRGPRHSVSSGVLVLAQKSGCPIIPVAIGFTRFWELPSWDRFRIPKPFSKGYSCWGEPLHVPAEAGAAELEKLAQELRTRLLVLERYADDAATHDPGLAGSTGPRPQRKDDVSFAFKPVLDGGCSKTRTKVSTVSRSNASCTEPWSKESKHAHHTGD